MPSVNWLAVAFALVIDGAAFAAWVAWVRTDGLVTTIREPIQPMMPMVADDDDWPTWDGEPREVAENTLYELRLGGRHD